MLGHMQVGEPAISQAAVAPPSTLIETVVISLRSAAERRRATTEMLQGSGLRWSYFDAHIGLACEELSYDKEQARRHFGTTLTPQQIAVHSSHYAVWQAFLKNGSSQYLLVLEDDLILDTAFPFEEFAVFCARFGMDYVRLFAKHYAPATRLGFFFDRSLMRYHTSPNGTQAYLLSATGARLLVACCRSIDVPVDLAMDRFWNTGLPLYSIYPHPVIERFVPTSIPIPDQRSDLSRVEKWGWDIYRALHKTRKYRANRRLAVSDNRIREIMPAFHQVIRHPK